MIMRMLTSKRHWLFSSLLAILSVGIAFEHGRARLGVDYGPRLIGLATSNPFDGSKPLSTIPNTGDLCKISDQILSTARSKGAVEVVLGIPLDNKGKLSYNVKNFNGKLCLQFSKVLCAVANEYYPRIKIVLVDERFSTLEAKVKLRMGKNRASLDAMSAACILERYEEDEGEYSINAEACAYPPPKELAFLDYETVKQHLRDLYSSEPTAKELTDRAMQRLKNGERTRD